jgi:hypothetical protein
VQGSKPIEAPRLSVDEDNRVINLDTAAPERGIVVFGPKSPASCGEESPTMAMRRWSEFRQSPVHKNE